MATSLFMTVLLVEAVTVIAQNGAELTTPFASLPGMTTQQVVNRILSDKALPYTNVAVQDATYKSILQTEHRGMSHLHTITNLFLSLILPASAIPPGIHFNFSIDESATAQVNSHNFQVEFNVVVEQLKKKWDVVLFHYAGMIATFAVGVLLAVVIPITGFFVCCCRYAGRCGSKSESFEKRRDKCKRVMLGIFLGLLLILVSFGIICAFVSNSNVQDGVDELPPTLRNAASDVQTYFNNTEKEYHTLLVTNYRELEQAISNALDEGGKIVTDELKYVSHAVAMDNLTSIVNNLGEIRSFLGVIVRDTATLQDLSGELEPKLNQIKVELKELMDSCSGIAACENLKSKYDLDSLSIDRKFKELPDVQQISRNISSLIENGVERELQQGKNALQGISNQIQNAISQKLPQVKQQLTVAGQRLERVSEDVSLLLGRGISLFKDPEIDRNINVFQTYLDRYGQYRFYMDIGMAGVLLLILICFSCGLACGCCGKRPSDPYYDQFGTKGTGASCIIAGISLVFLTSFFMLILTAAHFLLGAVGKLSCEVLNNVGDEGSANQVLYASLDDSLPLTPLHPTGVMKNNQVTLTHFVRECHRNQTLYQALQLERVFNMTSFKDRVKTLNIGDEVRQLTGNIKFNTDVTLLTPEAKKQLRAFVVSDLTKVNFTAYSISLERDITAVNLLEYAKTMNETAVQVQPFNQEASSTLFRNAALLMNLQDSKLVPIKAAAKRLRDAAVNVEKRIRFNQSSLPDAIEMLIGQAEAAQKFIRSKGPDQLIELAEAFGRECERKIEGYAHRVEDHVLSKAGKCWPLSQTYNTTTGVLCEQVFMPFNGFWASIGWSFLLFLPCVILGFTLSSLYRKTDPYPGSLVETGRDRDRRSAAPHSTGNPRSNHSYGQVYGGYEDDYNYSQHQARSGNNTRGGLGSVVAPADWNGKSGGRYQDPAQRAWSEQGVSEPAPRYVASPVHTAPAMNGQPSAPAADYERPPPYYYPGPADIK